jgi:hypothetical protein
VADGVPDHLGVAHSLVFEVKEVGMAVAEADGEAESLNGPFLGMAARED